MLMPGAPYSMACRRTLNMPSDNAIADALVAQPGAIALTHQVSAVVQLVTQLGGNALRTLTFDDVAILTEHHVSAGADGVRVRTRADIHGRADTNDAIDRIQRLNGEQRGEGV